MKDFGDSEEETPPERGASGGEGGEPSPEATPAGQDELLLLPPPSSPPPSSQPPEPVEPDSEPPPYILYRWGKEGATTAFDSPTLAEVLEETKRATEERAKRRRRRLGLLWEVLETVLLALLIFLAVRATFQNFRVEGFSMAPSLDNGQYLIVNKLSYATIDTEIFDWVPFFDPGEDSVHHIFGAPGRGDVIVFQSPNDPNRDFIKRIIGAPGDHVEVANGSVILNGEVLEESYIGGSTTCTGDCVWDVPEGHYLVLGDNRPNSSDSRTFGTIPEENIIGKAFISYWPLDNVGLAPNQSISFAEDQTEAEE